GSRGDTWLQTVFTRVWEGAGRYDATRGSVATWLLSWIRNGSIDRLRRRDALHGAPLPSVDRATLPGHDDAPVDVSEEKEKLARAVADLPADQRQVIELAY